MNGFFNFIQKKSLPGLWSKGISLARENAVSLIQKSDHEVVFNVKVKDKPVSYKVSLWIEDEDYFCSCPSKVDPCEHVIASTSALKNNLFSEMTQKDPSEVLFYHFKSIGSKISLERVINQKLLLEPLIKWIGGIDSGRILEKKPTLTQEDYQIDQFLLQNPVPFTNILKALLNSPFVTFNGEKCEVRSKIEAYKLKIIEKNQNQFWGHILKNERILQLFENGIVQTEEGLQYFDPPSLTEAELLFFNSFLKPEGKIITEKELPHFVTEILPSLSEIMEVDSIPENFPKVVYDPPRIRFLVESLDEKTIAITPRMHYPSIFCKKNSEKEMECIKSLRSKWNTTLNQTTYYKDEEAIEILNQLKYEDVLVSERIKNQFTLEDTLTPKLQIQGDLKHIDFDVQFTLKNQKKVSTQSVFQAWKEQKSIVPLMDGGFAKLPLDWFREYGHRIEKFLLLKKQNEKIYLTELIDLSQEMQSELDPTLSDYKEKMVASKWDPHFQFPDDLTVELREYQKEGIRWLSFLRESGMGALLADDMGLGKTLQTICALKGKTLIICPTSVLSNWTHQIKTFRKNLRVNFYAGPHRKIDDYAEVTLTSYGILRNDQNYFLNTNWETIVIDEAQNIKNTTTQVSKIAHQLKGDFKIALSGTPIENDLEDLWSQFQFINPGLLGDRSQLRDEPIEVIQRKVKPFILRRLKTEVAKELPPKTEITLENELNENERHLYESLLLTHHKEVIEKLNSGETSVIGALELLLRLRQACCHPRLIPGETAYSSSKCDLLFEMLSSSLSRGHKSLVFSQWTAYLDILEEMCVSKKISYLRLDGETKNRSELIEKFQSTEGPPVFLISLKAGGVGITLTAADHVYLMDSWWNPAVEDQAADRAHRIGQTKPVIVYRLISKDTIEEKIGELQKKKKNLSDQILTGTNQSSKLTKEDIIELLS